MLLSSMALHKKAKIPLHGSVGMVQILTTNCWLRKQQGIPTRECRDCSSPNYSFECCCSVARVFEDLCSPKIQMNSLDLNDPRTAVRGI